MNPRVADLRAPKRVVEDVAWLSLHQSYVQAAKRLGEVLRAVEQHLHRLLHLLESAQAFVSGSEPARCQACLRKLSRALERHEQRDRALLSLISAEAD